MEPFIADLINNSKVPKPIRYAIVKIISIFIIFIGIISAEITFLGYVSIYILKYLKVSNKSKKKS